MALDFVSVTLAPALVFGLELSFGYTADALTVSEFQCKIHPFFVTSLFFAGELKSFMPGIFKGNRSAYRKFRIVKFVLAFASSMIIVLLFHSAELLLIHSEYGLSNWTSYAAGVDILFYNIRLKIVEICLHGLLFSALGIIIIILLVEVLTIFFKKAIFVILIMAAIELPLNIVLAVTGHSGTFRGSVISYFGFSMLYLPTFSVIIQVILIFVFCSVGLWGHYSKKQ